MASGERLETVSYEFRPGEQVYRVRRVNGGWAKDGPSQVIAVDLRVIAGLILRRCVLRVPLDGYEDGAFYRAYASEADLFRSEEAAIAEAFLRNGG
jgi:hypothetical protein